MISGNTEIFSKPLRQISGKVEVIDTSTDLRTGSIVRLDGCAAGLPLTVNVANRNLANTIDALTTNATVEEATYDYITASGNVSNTPGTNAIANGWLVIPMALKANTTYTLSLTLEVLEQMTDFAFPATFRITFGGVYEDIEVSGLGSYTYTKTLQPGVDTSSAYITLNSCKVKVSNIVVNEGETAIYTAHIPTDTIKVSRIGKNLFDYFSTTFSENYIWWKDGTRLGNATTSTGFSCSDYVPVGHLRGQTIMLNPSPYGFIESGSGNAGACFYDAAKNPIEGSGSNGSKLVVPANASYLRFSVPRAVATADTVQIQIELGDTITDYEDYKTPQIATSNEEGVVEGLTSLMNNTVFVEGQSGIDITASYSVEVAGDVYTANDKLQSIVLERTGENKFFGFGISQKATISIIDKECLCGLAKGDKAVISFNDIGISPRLIIDDVSRDERTGNVKVVAIDAIGQASRHTVSELKLPSTYTIGELTDICCRFLETPVILPEIHEFSISYEGGANFDGAETVREALNAIAEATQTVYFVNRANEMVFKRLDDFYETLWTIDRSQYFSLTNKSEVQLTGICAATDLGENIEANTGSEGITQYVRNNPLWEMREDISQTVRNAIAAVGDMKIHQFNCSWRGNYLVEPGDKIALITKDGETLYTFLVNDKIEYNGGYKQTTEWDYGTVEKEHSNPSTLGEVIKQTYAKVDKVNKQIDMVVSEVDATKSEIAALQLTTDGITASVSSLQNSTSEAFNGVGNELAQLTSKVEATMTSEQIKFEISKGVDKVKTTSKGYTFDDSGLTISSSENTISTTITEDGMTVSKDSQEVLTANNEGVQAIDLVAKTFLIIGNSSRLQDYEGRTACFWIG